MSEIRVALVHDWLNGMRGGEAVLEAMADVFPSAEIFTLLRDPHSISPKLRSLPAHVSGLHRMPGGVSKYRHYLPLMPYFIEKFDLSGFDLILSSSHCVAKGVRKPQGAVHVSYVHAPMRYMWDRFDDYFGPGKSSWLTRSVAQTIRPYLRSWDRKASRSQNVDRLIANSGFIRDRILEFYGRHADVVYPFADLSRFFKSSEIPKSDSSAEKFYLMVGAFAPYKRTDLAIEAFNRMNLPLWIVGRGQEEERLRKLAGPTIRFLGAQTNEEVDSLYANCRGFVFPGVEDFGITPLEAMASGAPVIAFRAGGASETVTSRTGIFFEEQSVEALMTSIEELESGKVVIDPSECRKRASAFTRERFQQEWWGLVRESWIESGKSESALRSVSRI